jgi:hypothetical protein
MAYGDRHITVRGVTCARERPMRPVKQRLGLTSGPRLHFIILMIFNYLNFEF